MPRINVSLERTTAGLREALFCEMEDLRAGVATPHEAFAFAKLAENVIASFAADLVAERILVERERLKALPPPLDKEEGVG